MALRRQLRTCEIAGDCSQRARLTRPETSKLIVNAATARSEEMI